MGRMNLSQRSYSNKLCSTKNAYEHILQNYGAKAHKDCLLMLFSVRSVLDRL